MPPTLPSLALLSLVAAPAWAEEREVRLGEREPIAVVVATPTGENAQVRSSEVIRVVSDLLRARTDLTLELVESAALIECKGRLLCLIEKIGGGRAGRKEAPGYLLVFSNVTREGEPDRLSAQLVDVERASDQIVSGLRDREEWRPEVEASINDGAVSTERANVRDVVDAERVITEWFERRFAGAFESTGHWEPYGEVVIVVDREGLEISVDGQPAGATAAGRTRIREVRAGTRQLALSGLAVERYTTTIEVKAGQAIELEPEISSAGSAGLLRRTVLVSGAVMAAAGLVATIAAIAQHDGGVVTHCFDGTPACASGSGFETSGFDSDAASTLSPANGGGVLMLPLGYSLIGAGASWSIGAMLADEEEVPWIPMAIGTGVGILAYVISAAASTRPEVP